MIRPATEADIVRMAEIVVFNNRINYYPIFGDILFSFHTYSVPAVIREFSSDPSFLPGTYVWEDQVVRGFLQMKGTELFRLHVDPCFQNNGIGSCLLTYAVNVLHADRVWVLEKNVRARRFYARHGFTQSSLRKTVEDTSTYVIRMDRTGP